MLKLSEEDKQRLTQRIISFLLKQLSSVNPSQLAELEIEAKLGTFIDKNTGNRIVYSLKDEESSNSENAAFEVFELASGRGKWHIFESGIGISSHKKANGFLNERFVTAKKQAAQKPLPDSCAAWYKHTKTSDQIYQTRGSGFDKLRATYEAAADGSQRLVEVINKERVADMAIHLPHAPFDVRISVNIEKKVSPDDFYAVVPPGAQASLVRAKDRLSYRMDALLQTDLTAVAERSAVEYEVECEFMFSSPASMTRDGFQERTLRLIQELEFLAGAVHRN